MIINEVFTNGLVVAGLGLAGVFLTLILFYILTKMMMVFSNKKS